MNLNSKNFCAEIKFDKESTVVLLSNKIKLYKTKSSFYLF